ncbi:probable E3 ubiquitin-protein ligase RHA4A isoform X2 [Mercurialis annua]|uniref:probable E3 ubiquitin-protein ligase RHA4A isoform X2 n=1 Tax=Mercurialis annua TaxID=3986 RepID=UPI00215EDC3D|nr:probable E3 ubiquitin-protein ligase RHA4A isoform X2 [Mercurialis annua]
MANPPTSSPTTHLYPQALQLKLYQAFIFSIPILFSIILFLLFYLFYLKRRATSLSSPSNLLPTLPSNQIAPRLPSIGLKQEIKDKLPIVLCDEELRTRESQCCVCLGEFEIKEELVQIPNCKHVFHIECINHWLHSNTTCPLCRSFVKIPTSKLDHQSSDQDHHDHEQQQEVDNNPITDQQQHVLNIQESSVNSVSAADENVSSAASQDSVALHIQIQ